MLIGACADKIESAILKAQKGALTVKGQKPPARAFTLEDAVAKAVSLANEGNSIVLSPACASYDMFKDFEDRGGQFKAIVNDILNR